MGVPILLALLSLGIGLMLITLGAAFTNVNTITPTLAAMIGLGVGIDYALFIVTRFRQAMHEGMAPRDAAASAVSTSGRAVIFAGLTVTVAISSLAIIGLDFITVMGLGAAVTVAVAVAAAVTLLPAVLSLLGHRVDRLRGDVVPDALRGTGATGYVGGQTAVFEDIAARMSERLPIFVAAVIGIIFLLIAMSFRSVVVAAKAALTSLLSALAAFGILVAVFQEGWGASLIGVGSTGPIESFLPAIMFAILFGLSTDYEVFLMSRIREEHVAGAEPHRAITDAIAAIGRVVVAAALIMGSVFFSFMLGAIGRSWSSGWASAWPS
jgi:uncharacterized membrane protein YdfJ with MMPL/SSD domain